MKIIIVGGGKVGFYLAQTLSAQGHEAAIIEQDRELCRMIANQLDISICTGDGTSQDVQREAGAERADVVCAVTGKDRRKGEQPEQCRGAPYAWGGHGRVLHG